MANNEVIYSRLGTGVLDLGVGDWMKCDDIAGYSFVRHPDQDLKYYSHQLLRILGKHFCAKEAYQIWHEIERYRARIEAVYSPPSGAQGHLQFDKTAQEWYTIYGPRFEKLWYLTAPLDIHYARTTGREKTQGRWLRLLHPDLIAFSESGFSPILVLAALWDVRPGGLWTIAKMLFGSDKLALARLWTKLAALLMNFELDNAALDRALTEITAHAAYLSHKEGYPVGAAEVAMDYFRRLDLGGLGVEVITGELNKTESN